MKLFTASQIRAWDRYTIEREGIRSVDLRERAAAACVSWLLSGKFDSSIAIFCGKGNNGGDGLAMARLLLQRGIDTEVYVLDTGRAGTADFEHNLATLKKEFTTSLRYIASEADFPDLSTDHIIIDALFGSGLNKALSGLAAGIVDHINRKQRTVISIDVPSGLYMDQSSKGNTIIRASYVLTFQTYKEALLQAENAPYTGIVHVLDIGLDQSFEEQEPSRKELVDKDLIQAIFKPRPAFAHKGDLGHALIASGSFGKMGACQLAAGACLRTGVGLLSCLIPGCGYTILQTAVPEAMALTDCEDHFLTQLPDAIEKYSAIGIGPGIGTAEATQKLVGYLLRRYKKPIVIDADGLNCLSLNKEWLAQLPAQSVLTPHPKEFERLFGETVNEIERIELAMAKAKELNVVIVLKGHHTFIATSGGRGYYNSTGNAGMATGGSGDVLTGIITSLLAQQYEPVAAALLGVYIHGMAGDLAAERLSMESMIASDITDHLSDVFLQLNAL